MFISVCGIEGCGKTTQVQHIARFFQGMGKTVVLTREPGGTRIGQRIRQILLDPENHNLAPKAELFLYAADRVQHISQVIRPALEKGHIVVTDRFVDSTTVYQGYARGIDMELVEKINRMVLNGLKPDITFLLDLDPEIGLRRVHQQLMDGERAAEESRFELETLEFHEKIRQGFLTLAEMEPDRFRTVDASRAPEKVREKIFDFLKSALGS